MIERTLRDILKDSATISDRVDGKIFAGNVPQGETGECVVITDVSATHNYHLGGESGTRVSVVSIDCYADNASRAESLFELIRNRISGAPGGDVIDSAIIVGGGGASQESPKNKSDKWFYRYSKDFECTHLTTVPTNA